MNTDIYARTFQSSDKEALVVYLSKAYPNRESLNRFVDYTLFSVPNGWSKESLLVFKGTEIIGANMFLQANVRIGMDEFPMFWSYDTKVLDEYRTTDAGTFICERLYTIRNCFGAGLSDISIDINRRMHSKFIGKSVAFIKLNFSICKYAFAPLFPIFRKKDLKDSDYPNEIKTHCGIFTHLKTVSDLHLVQGNYWNKGIIEFERSEKFLNWRFFALKDKYQVYACHCIDNSKNDIYFACRQYSLGGIPLLYVVDYRFDIIDDEAQKSVIKAIISLASHIGFAGVYIRSSLLNFSNKLKQYGFIEKKGGADIVAHVKPAIKDDFLVFHTSADSDMDFKIKY